MEHRAFGDAVSGEALFTGIGDVTIASRTAGAAMEHAAPVPPGLTAIAGLLLVLAATAVAGRHRGPGVG